MFDSLIEEYLSHRPQTKEVSVFIPLSLEKPLDCEGVVSLRPVTNILNGFEISQTDPITYEEDDHNIYVMISGYYFLTYRVKRSIALEVHNETIFPYELKSGRSYTYEGASSMESITLKLGDLSKS